MAPSMAPNGSGELGNTRTNSPRINASKYWCFTRYPKENDDVKDMLALLAPRDTYIIGFEICPKTNKQHWQGYICFHIKKRPIEYFGKYDNTIHWEKCKGDELDNYDYCSKDGKFVTNIEIEEELDDYFIINDAKKWHLDLLELVKTKPMNRRILHWRWSKQGQMGKSAFARHLLLKSKYNMAVDGAGKDILCGISLMKENIGVYPKVLLIDLTCENSFISYSTIEKLQNGFYFSGKYKSAMELFNAPHIIVFANVEPDYSALKPDRWDVVNVD